MSAAPPFDLERGRLTAGADLRPEHFDEFQRLAKTLLHGPAFQLLFIECADAGYRKRIMAALDALLRGARLRTSRLPIGARIADVPALEARLRRHAAAVEVVHMLGGARWFDSARWDDLNQRRERLARDARARLVFWLDAASIALLSRYAQDLWAWRSGVYAFATAGAGAPFEFPVAALPSAPYSQNIDARSMAQRYRRIAELKRMQTADPPPPDDLLRPLLDEVGRLLYDTGQYDHALAHWREVERPFHLRRKDEREVAVTSGQIADVLAARGELDEALRIRREEELPVYEKLGDARERAVALGKITDVLAARGELDEALRIRREEELPVYEKLGDVRERALTLGKIADVLAARGELDEALKIWNEELLPVFKKLGDVRSRAVTLGRIADVLAARGELDEALRIRREEELPVYEKIGDVHSRAITLGQIADVLTARGELDEALRIYREEGLPIFEKLGAVRERTVCRAKISIALMHRHGPGDRAEAERLLTLALADATRLQLPEAGKIGDWLARAKAETTG